MPELYSTMVSVRIWVWSPIKTRRFLKFRVQGLQILTEPYFSFVKLWSGCVLAKSEKSKMSVVLQQTLTRPAAVDRWMERWQLNFSDLPKASHPKVSGPSQWGPSKKEAGHPKVSGPSQQVGHPKKEAGHPKVSGPSQSKRAIPVPFLGHPRDF